MDPHRFAIPLALVIFSAFVASTLSQSQSPAPNVKAVPISLKSKSNNLGYQVAIWNGNAVISAPNCVDTHDCDGGYLLLYQKINGVWWFDRKARNPFRNRDNKYGLTMEANSYYLMVSMPYSNYENKDIGGVFFYKWNIFGRMALPYLSHDSRIRFRKSDSSNHLGTSISNMDTVTTIGMPEFDSTSDVTDSGCAHIFTMKDTGKWGNRLVITAPVPVLDEWFGSSVSMQSTTRIAVSNNPTSTSTAIRSVYIFDLAKGEWSFSHKLSDGGKLGFGWKIAFFDDLLYISALNDASPGATKAGSISVFKADSEGMYSELYNFKPKTAVTNGRFGFSFATDGARFVVGNKPCEDAAACGIKGAVYTFTKDSSNRWVEQYKFAPGKADGSDNFGYDVAVYGDTVLASAPFKPALSRISINRQGVVYFLMK